MPKSLAEQIRNRCIHFNGISNEKCKCGIAYESVRDSSTRPYRWPCHRDDDAATTCERREFFTAEQVAERVKEIQESTGRTMLAMAAVCEEAERLGLKKGKGGGGKIPCPVCKTGELGFSVASYNGHIWGKCSTEDCVSWMQ